MTCWSRNAALFITYGALQAVLIPAILEISSMSVNSEASRVRSLIKHFCRLKSIWKMDNLPSNAMFRYVLTFIERKWLYLVISLSMIVKHEFSYFETCICFRTEQLVARILSNKYIWLLLKYKTDELGTHSDPRRKNISITRNSLPWRRVKTNNCVV